jgi:hypothetical protein
VNKVIKIAFLVPVFSKKILRFASNSSAYFLSIVNYF